MSCEWGSKRWAKSELGPDTREGGMLVVSSSIYVCVAK
jgi:hypothetical protein